MPGIIFTLVAWLIGSTVFAAYLDHFSSYVTTYAGLASIMIAVVFLYIISAIFILGGELNAAISRYLEARARVAALSRRQADPEGGDGHADDLHRRRVPRRTAPRR